MSKQIKKLEFTDWLYFFLSSLDNLFEKLTELGTVSSYDFPRIEMLYLTDMFWGSEVSLATKECKTQEEYTSIIKQLSEKEIENEIRIVLKNKAITEECINTTVENLNINFFFTYQ